MSNITLRKPIHENANCTVCLQEGYLSFYTRKRMKQQKLEPLNITAKAHAP